MTPILRVHLHGMEKTHDFFQHLFWHPHPKCPMFQARKKSTKINFLGPETARWGGGLPLEGVVAKNFVPALESLSSLGFEERNLGCPGNFAGMSRTPGAVQKVCAKKLRAHFSFPNVNFIGGIYGAKNKSLGSPQTGHFGLPKVKLSFFCPYR